MEALSRLVTESLVRHGFDRPLDYRRLHWSRWFRCESHHSLLFVPSQPGVFAVAEEITSGAPEHVEAVPTHVATGASPVPRPLNEAKGSGSEEERSPRRLLAVTQFFEDDDMAFVLDRMLSTQNPMRARLISGRYFVRFVVIEDPIQRRSICNALNQWMASSAEKASGIGSLFATSLELTPATEYVPEPNEGQGYLFAEVADEGSDTASVETTAAHVVTAASPVSPARSAAELGMTQAPITSHSTATALQIDSGAASNIHCPSPLPSGF
jgi:hypothetical protein